MLRVFENRLLRGKFWIYEEKLAGGWRDCTTSSFIFCIPVIIRVMKREKKWTGCITHVRENKTAKEILIGNTE
jgi:hypothetical protein